MRGHGVSVGFLDFALNLVCILLAIFIISSMDPPKKQDGIIVPKAEFLITITWDDNSSSDIDLYVRTPDGDIIYFRNPRSAIAYLDQDDQGMGNATKSPDGETINVATRQEVVTLRGIMAGDYLVNAHEYNKRSATIDHVKLVITKINPYRVVTTAEADFDSNGQEQTLANFTVDKQGYVSSVYRSPEKLVGENGYPQ